MRTSHSNSDRRGTQVAGSAGTDIHPHLPWPQLFTRLQRIVSGDLVWFGGPEVDNQLQEVINAEQVATVKRYLPWTMLANSCNALVLVAALWTSPSPDRLLAGIWAAVMVGISGYHVWRNKRWAPTNLPRPARAAIPRAVRNALIIGSLWGAMPLLFFTGASSGGQLIIICLCAGMLCGGAFAFASVPAAAVAFIGAIFIGSAIAIARAGNHQYVLVAVLLAVYTCILVRGVFVLAAQLVNRISAHNEVEKQVRKDTLTGLGNRLYLDEALSAAFARLADQGEQFALLYLDLDGFKSINDTYGHAIGDRLLSGVAKRLMAGLRSTDILTRLGGDEFGLVAAPLQSPREAREIAAKALTALQQPFFIAGSAIMAPASIGIAIAPSDGTGPETLLKHADIALYRAKRQARGTLQFFEFRHDANARERWAIEQDLRRALDRNEFFLVYQPVLDLRSQQIVACEALLRWRHPTRGVVRPGDFVEIAERAGLIDAIGTWVVRQACRAAASWPAETHVAVNFSAAQFRNTGVLATVVGALRAAKLIASRLEVEITESVFISESDVAMSLLNGLKALGVRIALDDFGTGYSSLTYLRRLPLDKIKIDRSFVRDMLSQPDCNSIVKSVIGLATELRLQVTAEGVETPEQLFHLARLGCGEAQGTLISDPLDISRVEAIFRRDYPWIKQVG